MPASAILSNPNFWTTISGFVGTVIGGAITWVIQKNSERNKIHAEQVSLFRYHITRLEKISGLLGSMWDHIKSIEKFDDRHLRIRRWMVHLPPRAERDITIDLYFLATKTDLELIGKMEDISARFEVFESVFKERNQHFQMLALILENQHRPEFNPKEIPGLIGTKLNADLKAATDILFENSKYVFENYPALREKLGRTFKRLFPKESLVVLDLQVESGQSPIIPF